MAEKSALNDAKNLVWKGDPRKDSYKDGMTVEDAYRYLASAPRRPIQTTV